MHIKGPTMMFETPENNLRCEAHVVRHSRRLGKGDLAGRMLPECW